jgi:3-demethoxyubiquinol 3-hydroxylase
MKEGEEQHLATLSRMMQQRRVRPTALLPLWNAAGWALGAVSGVFGLQTAMAATVAIETAIGAHYNDQIRDLLREGYGDDERELMAVFKQHRDEEMAHLDTGVAHGAQDAPLYGPLSAAVKAGCAAAIEVAKRV